MTVLKTIGFKTKKMIISQMLNLVTNLSEENIVKLVGLASKLAPKKEHRKMAQDMKNLMLHTPCVKELVRRINTQLSPESKKALLQTFFINSNMLGKPKKEAFAKKEGIYPPSLVVIDVTDRCNLKCPGCWAGNYSEKTDIPLELLNRIVDEGKEMGIYFYTLAGGEPFIRKDLVDFFERNKDCFFLIYTNGICITEEAAKRMSKIGNAACAISVEGLKKETDERRGPGTYDKIVEKMKMLKKYGILFGTSTMVTKYNTKLLSSDEFYNHWIEKGALFAWLFQYMPIGRDPDVSLMSTPEQRTELRKYVHEARKRLPIFIGDFWNDGQFVGGCMAGGLNYLHITNKGQIEPCVFAHFYVDNIKDTTLKDALKSDFFMAIRKAHPYSKNHNLLTPCMIIDNPQVLRGVVKKYGAKPSHPAEARLVEDPVITEHLDNYSKRMHELTDKEWETDFKDWDEKWFGKKGSKRHHLEGKA